LKQNCLKVSKNNYLKVIQLDYLHMATFLCKRCNYETVYKSSIVKHLQKKKSCDAIYEDIDRSKLLEEFKKEKNKEEYIYKCTICDTFFKYRSNLSRHEANCSKKQQDKDNKHIKELESRIEKLEKKSLVATKNKTVNNTQNIININLRDFGNENHNHLSKDLLHKWLSQLIENLHFDVKCPENNNVRLKSTKRELVEIYQNGRWLVKDQDQILTELIQNGYRILRMHGYKNKSDIMDEEELDEDDYKRIVKWLEKVYEDRKAQKSIKRDLIILLINNETMILERPYVEG
jgi:hypothetical protein